ncbi:flagellar basal body P-ring protein FlgI [Rhodoferax sp. TS-BS-61-7]|uniref:flagellar basal body P-ring protein FlgI n=1 Tax=Rhodoferax sp. TS-BS-61-7 TaxID=2094194 RepID=UPI000CF600A7|nr:flagellar basal body P-ring protein FlgI [Rhodoferax sp. TS-BS-61-7]PQA77777.1 flagellar biosynthesis protein FlgI [Rhodoferax sp. TS-BS-61-7]
MKHWNPTAITSGRRWLGGLCVALVVAGSGPAMATRIKEVASIEGVRSNQLTGFGLVVGLDGTGDQTTQMPYTTQGLKNYMEQLGLTLTAASQAQLQMKNVAAVLVTAQLPAFARPGQMLDINVSSLGNSKSLKGGTLIATPLKGADGEVYALAQGNLIVAGAGAAAGGSKVQVNHLSAGRIPDGAQVERSVPTALQEGPTINLSLSASDFQTARKVAQSINNRFGNSIAQALDGRTVQVKAPTSPNERVNFIAEMEELTVENSIAAAKVIINSRTGSIVMNQAVTLGPCAVAHGNLSISVSSTPVISQPNALSGGQTVVGEKANIDIKQEAGKLIQLPAATQLTDVVKALNSLGATPQDLLAILQAIKSAGALNAELEVI